MFTVELKRAYEPVARGDGTRFLVERLWPRGVPKRKLQVAGWLKDAAPSAELRRWFGHDPAKWDEFRRRYHRELDAHPEAWQPIVAAARRGAVTLVYSARDTEHNAAVALREYLMSRARAGAPQNRKAPRAKAAARGGATPRRPGRSST